jgi:hypothetical protein
MTERSLASDEADALQPHASDRTGSGARTIAWRVIASSMTDRSLASDEADALQHIEHERVDGRLRVRSR